MKRFNIACILILIVSLMLTACSPGKPNDLDELQNIGSGLIMSADELLRFFESGKRQNVNSVQIATLEMRCLLFRKVIGILS